MDEFLSPPNFEQYVTESNHYSRHIISSRYVSACLLTHVCVQMCYCVCVCMCVSACIYVCEYVCMWMGMHSSMYVCVLIHTYIDILIHIALLWHDRVRAYIYQKHQMIDERKHIVISLICNVTQQGMFCEIWWFWNNWSRNTPIYEVKYIYIRCGNFKKNCDSWNDAVLPTCPIKTYVSIYMEYEECNDSDHVDFATDSYFLLLYIISFLVSILKRGILTSVK